jgi:hypothetical protein
LLHNELIIMSLAKELPVFLNLFPKNDQFAPCVIKEKQKWRCASASAAVKGLTEAAKYFPELSSLLDSLDDYSYANDTTIRLS